MYTAVWIFVNVHVGGAGAAVHSKSLAMRCKCVRERTGLCPRIESQWCLYFEAKSDFQKDPELCLYVLVHLELHEQSLIDEEDSEERRPACCKNVKSPAI
jgi:hypothetical protein